MHPIDRWFASLTAVKHDGLLAYVDSDENWRFLLEREPSEWSVPEIEFVRASLLTDETSIREFFEWSENLQSITSSPHERPEHANLHRAWTRPHSDIMAGAHLRPRVGSLLLKISWEILAIANPHFDTVTVREFAPGLAVVLMSYLENLVPVGISAIGHPVGLIPTQAAHPRGSGNLEQLEVDGDTVARAVALVFASHESENTDTNVNWFDFEEMDPIALTGIGVEEAFRIALSMGRHGGVDIVSADHSSLRSFTDDRMVVGFDEFEASVQRP